MSKSISKVENLLLQTERDFLLLAHSKEEEGKSCSCLASLWPPCGFPMTGELHRKCYLCHQQHLAQLGLQGPEGGGCGGKLARLDK